MMKRKLIITISVAASVAFLLLGHVSQVSGAQSTDKVYEFSYNNVTSSTHRNATHVIEPWVQLVSEKTNGRIKIAVYHNCALGPTNSTWQDVNNGIYDIGGANLPYFADTELFPLTVANLPFAFDNSLIAVKVLNKYAKRYESSIFKKSLLLSIGSTDPVDLFSKKPVRSLSDLKNLKTRVGGRIDVELVKAWGGVPVTMKFTDMYESLSKNIIEASLFNPVGVTGNRLYEVAPYLTVIRLSTVQFPYFINRKSFEKLPKDLQDIFMKECAPKLGEFYAQSYFEEGKNILEVIKKHLSDSKKEGGIIHLSEADLKKMREPSKAIWDSWVKDADKKGYQGEEMIKHFKQVMQEEGAPLPF